MTPLELKQELLLIVERKLMDPLMIMGPSGIGKTSVAEQVAASAPGFDGSIPIYDVRWGQLMPADARGVPVPDMARRVTEFLTPTFWPRQGPGIIFLDEFNMATPAMMGLGQQLLLSRRFGDYSVPEGIFIWAAGNRKTDRATVNEVPGPVNNRLAHYSVEPDLGAFEVWAYQAGLDQRIIGFLKWRSELLHKPNQDPLKPAWPSPRTWEMASRRLKAGGLSIGPVVGEDAEAEVLAYVEMVEKLPDIAAIVAGRGSNIPFPDEPSLKYATVAELTRRSMEEYGKFQRCFSWAAQAASSEPEWTSMFVQDVVRILRINDAPKARRFLSEMVQDREMSRFSAEQAAAGSF